MLYGKAVMAWEGAADKCSGVRQQQAQRKAEQAQVDAHNAEHLRPPRDQATDHAQRLKAASGVSATERDSLSVKAEVAWREAFVQCRGSSQNLARGNADALARERGTPLSPQALAASGGGHGAAPRYRAGRRGGSRCRCRPRWWPSGRRQRRAPAGKPAGRAQDRRAEGRTAPAPAAEAVLVAGDTTYPGAFALAATGGAVSGSGRVEWTNGESYVGSLVEGRRARQGPLQLGRRPVVRGRLGGRPGHGPRRHPVRRRQPLRRRGARRRAVGRGTLIFPTGDRYTGDFARGVFHGQGRFAWKNGNRYEGAWRLGRKAWPGGA